MRILLDCDEVLLNLMPETLEALKARSHYRDLVPALENVNNFDLEKVFDKRLQDEHLKIWADPSFWVALPPVPGARDAVKALLEQGHEVYVVTSPYLKCDRWESARRRALNKHFGIAPEHIIFAKHKHLIGGDVFVDDRGENVLKWQKEHPEGLGIVMERPWSFDGQGAPEHTYMTSWTDGRFWMAFGRHQVRA